ncbi:TPA: hypothetical protein ACH3X1_003157 [Trebouxia sp. C0004]
MSAIQRLMTAASSGAASNSSKSSAYDDNKIEKRACELERRREKALKDTKGTARCYLGIATTHLKHAGCSKVKSDTEIAAQVAAAFIKDAAPEQQDPDDKEVLAQLQHKKRKTSGQPSVAERLAGPVLDKKYAETVGSVDQVLNVNGVHALAVSTI